MNKKIKVGSICSGIEAASVSFSKKEYDFKWFSEIEAFPSKVLKHHYPEIPNLGDMLKVKEKIDINNSVDLICAGTPCQAFSLAGQKKGLEDPRGNLTLELLNILEKNDTFKIARDKKLTTLFWENVEGILTDKTNAFGIFIYSLAGYDEDEIPTKLKWEKFGIIKGKKRNVAWRVVDAKFFGVPQQRKRVYVVATDKSLYPEDVLFEIGNASSAIPQENSALDFTLNNTNYQIFREYSDVLYASYGTKWNGNAAATNGSLFLSENNRLRRLTPLECERLMGFPDNYTEIYNSTNTNRYKALGNSWVVPVISFFASKMVNVIRSNKKTVSGRIAQKCQDNKTTYKDSFLLLVKNKEINVSTSPNNVICSTMKDIVEKCNDERLFLSDRAILGILRRAKNINPRLKNTMLQNLRTNTK